jgi:hypothetical protein
MLLLLSSSQGTTAEELFTVTRLQRSWEQDFAKAVDSITTVRNLALCCEHLLRIKLKPEEAAAEAVAVQYLCLTVCWDTKDA